jgi:DNA repair exonuclease SbcCD ATPase subunit
MDNDYLPFGSSYAPVGAPLGQMSADTLIQNLQRIREEEVHVPAPPSECTALSVVKDIGYELYQGTEPTKEGVRGELYETQASSIKETLESLRGVQTRFQEQIQKVHTAEANVKESFERTQLSIREVDEFVCFLEKLTDHGTETETIKTLLVELSTSIRDKDTSKELKESYESELEILQLYVHGFLKEVNGLNIGNTCPLCLQRPVTQFMNPCGHTGCDECLAKLSSETRSRCFMCRKHVSSLHKLYFC